MKIKPIKSEADCQIALARMEEILDASPSLENGDEAEILPLLIDHYESENYRIESLIRNESKAKRSREHHW